MEIVFNNGNLEITDLTVKRKDVYEYFNKISEEADRKNLSPEEKNQLLEESFIKVLRLGVLAVNEDRIGKFIKEVNDNIGKDIKFLNDKYNEIILEEEAIEKTPRVGFKAEKSIAAELRKYICRQQQKCKDKKLEIPWNDEVKNVGTSQNDGTNKTGDIECTFGPNGEYCIIIESKFDESTGIGSTERIKAKGDTAISQVVEAAKNRTKNGYTVPIIVFDKGHLHDDLKKLNRGIIYLPKQNGFIVVIDSENYEYSNLFIAYSLARDIASSPLCSTSSGIEKGCLAFMIDYLIKDMELLNNLTNRIKNLKEYNEKELTSMEQELRKYCKIINIDREYLSQVLTTGKLTVDSLSKFIDDSKECLKDTNADENELLTVFSKELQKKLQPVQNNS